MKKIAIGGLDTHGHGRLIRWLFCLGVLCLFLFPCGAQQEGFLSFDTRWDFPNYLSWRPANEEVVSVNPPRFSWPASPVIPTQTQDTFPISSYVMQLSSDVNFPPDKTIEKETSLNFENVFPVLDEGTWYWRVGYRVETDKWTRWSAVRSFTITATAKALDRSAISRAVEKLTQIAHPRLGPPDGDWTALRQRLETDPMGALMLKRLFQEAKRATRQSWWQDFPQGDTSESLPDPVKQWGIERQNVWFRDIGDALAKVALAYRFTGDSTYLPAYDYALQAAKFAPGGHTSPEHNGSPSKWGTLWTRNLAFVCDLGWDHYSPEQRTEMLQGIAWRSQAVYHEKRSWQNPRGQEYRSGLAGSAGSHPEEDAFWVAQGLFLLAGDLAVADEIIPVMLNYLIGVGSAFGPEGAWNEAGAYAIWKPSVMLDTVFIANKLLPELRLPEYPWFDDLSDFAIQWWPGGQKQQRFGDFNGRDMGDRDGNQRAMARVLRQLHMLQDRPKVRRALQSMTEAGYNTTVFTASLPYIAGFQEMTPLTDATQVEDELPPAQRMAEPGWFFVGSRSPSNWQEAQDNVRVVALGRPRAGYSHSYAADGGFIWQAYGTMLSTGGGAAGYGDAYARDGFSHNTVLVDGYGAPRRLLSSENPISARPLYWKQDAATGTTQWAIDVTGAFLAPAVKEEGKSRARKRVTTTEGRGNPGLQRWIRHFALVKGRDLVIVDDLAMLPEAGPARFSWLHHVPSGGAESSKHDESLGLRAQYTVDGVEAAVWQRADVPVEIQYLQGVDVLKNPISGVDFSSAAEKVNKQYYSEGNWIEEISGEVVVATTESVKEARFVSVLTAHPPGAKEAAQVEVTLDGIKITRGSEVTTLSINADGKGGEGRLNIPVDALRRHAAETYPYRLPATGTKESLKLGESDPIDVEWLRKDTFSDAAWVNRWWPESSAVLIRKIPGRGLDIQNAGVVRKQDKGTTLWLRADVPDRLALRVRAGTGTETEINACNLNLILRARESETQPLLLGNRSGVYKELQSQSNYIITLTGGDMEGWSRVRRNPGFEMKVEADVRTAPGQEYELLYLYDQGRLRMWVDGKMEHDWTDADPLPNGKIGLRTWSSHVQIHSVEIGRISNP